MDRACWRFGEWIWSNSVYISTPENAHYNGWRFHSIAEPPNA